MLCTQIAVVGWEDRHAGDDYANELLGSAIVRISIWRIESS